MQNWVCYGSILLWLSAVNSWSVPLTNVQDPIQLAHEINGDVKVPVVLGVMSQCPDAILCESVIDRVLDQVAGKVDLSLTFIGRSAKRYSVT